MILEQERNHVGIYKPALWNPSESDRPRAFLTKRPDQRHKFFRPFGVGLGVRFQVLQANGRPQDDARRKAYLVLGFRCFGPLWHLDFSLAQWPCSDRGGWMYNRCARATRNLLSMTKPAVAEKLHQLYGAEKA